MSYGSVYRELNENEEIKMKVVKTKTLKLLLGVIGFDRSWIEYL